MDCKNCTLPLRTDYSYCSNCGAKIIRNRLTLKNLWYDVTERYFNLDNTFLKTFLHLFTKPEVVIGGYIEGVRKKYLNPVSYLAIALTLSGILIFFMKRAFPEGMDFDLFDTGIYSEETSEKMTNFIFTFYSFLFLIYIPIFAFSGWLAFNGRKFVFTEYIVTFIYVQAQYSLLTFPITLIVLFFLPDYYMSFSMFSLFLMIGYAIYVMKRFAYDKKGGFILKTFVFLALFGVGFMCASILQFILMFATGTLSFEDFVPK